MEDERIIQLFWERSERALTETQCKYGKLLHRIAAGILRDARDAEEATMDTYMRLWDNIPPTKPTSLPGYSVKLCRNAAIDILRSQRRSKRDQRVEILFSELEECLTSSDSLSAGMEEQELIQLINRYLATLDHTSRTLFVRRYFAMEELEELATDFRMTKHVVSARLYRVRQGLRKYLQKEGVTV